VSEWREISLDEYDAWAAEEFRTQSIIHAAIDQAKELTEDQAAEFQAALDAEGHFLADAFRLAREDAT
jgi:hypothetical protein